MHNATWLTVNDVEVYVEIAGEGPTVFCVHTAGQSGVQFRRLLQALPALDYRVVVIDLPGHGRSEPAHGGPVEDLHEYAEYCWTAMVELSIEKPFLLGCSIGAKIALELCVNHSEHIAGVVAMEVDAYSGALSVSGLRRSMSDVASPSQGDRTFHGTLASLGTSVPEERAREIAIMHRREDNVITAADLIGWTTHDLRGRLGSVTCPILIIAGSDDFWIRPAWARDTARMIPLGEFRTLDGIGHYPMEEIQDFAPLLVEWLEELATRDLREGF